MEKKFTKLSLKIRTLAGSLVFYHPGYVKVIEEMGYVKVIEEMGYVLQWSICNERLAHCQDKRYGDPLFQVFSFRLRAVFIFPNLKNAHPLPSYTWDEIAHQLLTDIIIQYRQQLIVDYYSVI